MTKFLVTMNYRDAGYSTDQKICMVIRATDWQAVFGIAHRKYPMMFVNSVQAA